MPIEKKTWFSASCDGCKGEFESDAGVIALFETEAELKSAADYWKFDSKRVLCEDCAFEEGDSE